MSSGSPITVFHGIAPRLGANIKAGWAVIAENLNIASGKIRPVKSPLLKQADTNHCNSLSYYAGAWQLGDDRHYCKWKIGDYDLLISLISGVPYKAVDGVSQPLGQTRLDAPVAEENGSGDLDDTYYYRITTTRSVGGYTDESGPSDVIEITVSSKTIQITAPDIDDDYVTEWNIYRMSDTSGEYQFVATVDVGTTTYDDNTIDADLDTSPTTWYTSDQDNEIVWDKPLVTFDGMISEPYSGMLFAWKGPTLYWNEPGYPDAWPSYYNMNFPSNIKRVFPFNGALAVLCAEGPHRVDGTNPELLQPSKVIGKEPCVGLAACVTNRGVAYLSDSGIAMFDLSNSTVITDARFTEEWFDDNVDSSGALMEECDGNLYLFHSGGVLAGDLRLSSTYWEWTTMDLDDQVYALYKARDTGKLYYTGSAGVMELFGGSSNMKWTWKSGDLIGKHPGNKPYDYFEVIGTGAIAATIYADDVEKNSKALSFALDRNRRIKFPSETMARAAQIMLNGTGVVKDIIVGYTA